MKIIIVGGSGFIGSKISQEFARRGLSVICVDKVKPKVAGVDFVFADTEKAFPQDPKLKNPDGIINLAGVSVNGPWTQKHKQAMYSSRIFTTKNLISFIKQKEFRPRFFIQASAVGIYGDAGESLLSEGTSSKKNTFLSHLALDWEKEGSQASKYGVRTVIFRQANVLGEGRFLAALRPLYARGLGVYVGSGNNWLPWIHISDLVAMYMFAAYQSEVSGVYNCVSPELVRYKEFSKIYAGIFGTKFVFRLPTWLFRLRFRGFADEITASQKVISLRLWEWGPVIQHKKIKDALTLIEKQYESK